MTTATAESPMIILDLPAHPLAKVFSAEVARFIIGRNIARRHLSLRDQIKAAAEMLKLDPDFLPGRKSADKCKALAEFVGGFSDKTVRKYLHKDLTPKTDAELQEDLRQRQEADARRERERADEAEKEAERLAEEWRKAAEAEHVKSMFSDNGHNGDDPPTARSKAAKKVHSLRNLASNGSAAPGEAANAASTAERLIEKHGLTEKEIATHNEPDESEPSLGWFVDDLRTTQRNVSYVLWDLLAGDGTETTIAKIAEHFKAGDTKRLREWVRAWCERDKSIVLARCDDGSLDFSQPIRRRIINPTHLERAIGGFDDSLYVDISGFRTAVEEVVTQFEELGESDTEERSRIRERAGRRSCNRCTHSAAPRTRHGRIPDASGGDAGG